MSDTRGFTPWKHDEDEFDRDADEYVRLPWERLPRDWLDDLDDDDLEKWLGDRS